MPGAPKSTDSYLNLLDRLFGLTRQYSALDLDGPVMGSAEKQREPKSPYFLLFDRFPNRRERRHVSCTTQSLVEPLRSETFLPSSTPWKEVGWPATCSTSRRAFAATGETCRQEALFAVEIRGGVTTVSSGFDGFGPRESRKRLTGRGDAVDRE